MLIVLILKITWKYSHFHNFILLIAVGLVLFSYFLTFLRLLYCLDDTSVPFSAIISMTSYFWFSANNQAQGFLSRKEKRHRTELDTLTMKPTSQESGKNKFKCTESWGMESPWCLARLNELFNHSTHWTWKTNHWIQYSIIIFGWQIYGHRYLRLNLKVELQGNVYIIYDMLSMWYTTIKFICVWVYVHICAQSQICLIHSQYLPAAPDPIFNPQSPCFLLPDAEIPVCAPHSLITQLCSLYKCCLFLMSWFLIGNFLKTYRP